MDTRSRYLFCDKVLEIDPKHVRRESGAYRVSNKIKRKTVLVFYIPYALQPPGKDEGG